MPRAACNGRGERPCAAARVPPAGRAAAWGGPISHAIWSEDPREGRACACRMRMAPVRPAAWSDAWPRVDQTRLWWLVCPDGRAVNGCPPRVCPNVPTLNVACWSYLSYHTHSRTVHVDTRAQGTLGAWSRAFGSSKTSRTTKICSLSQFFTVKLGLFHHTNAALRALCRTTVPATSGDLG